MNRFLSALLFLPLISPLLAADNASDWKDEADKDGVVIQSRSHAGSALKEFRGIGLIEAPPSSVFAVIDDAEAYPNFMPYTSEVQIIRRTKDSLVCYQRLDLPLISDRDYTLLSKHETRSGPDGPSYRIHWDTANDLGPAPKSGVLRVTVCDGGWMLEPSGAGATRATYTIFTDSGGAIPAMIANSGSRTAIRKLFEAVRKQVKLPKYATKN